MEIKRLVFFTVAGMHSNFMVGRLEDNQILNYFIYRESNIIVIDLFSEKHYFNTIDEAKEFCQKDFEKFVNSLIEK